MRRVFADLLCDFLADESGATAIEYCLIAAGICFVIITSVNVLGTTLTGRYSAVSTQLAK